MAPIMAAVMPFTGHVTPVLAVVKALVAAGHDVRCYTGSAFADRVARAGARYVPWRHAPDFDENDLAATFPRLVGRKGLRQTLLNVTDCAIGTAPAQLADLAEEHAREPWDVLIGDELSVGSAFAAERFDTPWATIGVLPSYIPADSGPPSGLGLAPGTGALTRARDAVLRAITPALSYPLRPPLVRARRTAGLPPSRLRFDQTVFSPQLVVAGGAPLLDFGRADRPARLHFVGEYAAPDPGHAPLPSWWHDLDGRRVVHVTQGTQNIDPTDLIRPALEALADEDALVVATTGVRGRDRLEFAVPANARIAGYVPYAELLPRVDVMITNEGWGGTLAALGRGIPLVIAGGDLDKPEIAARVAWSGAGVNLRTGTPTRDQVADGYRRVHGDGSYRDAATRVAAQLHELGGATRAAELIAGLVAAPSPAQ